MESSGIQPSSFSLEEHGLKGIKRAHWNLNVPDLVEHALRRREGQLTKCGAFIALTGEHTGRSPNDRFIVDEKSTHSNIWWGPVNKPFSLENFDQLHAKMLEHFSGRDVFVQCCYAGADPANHIKICVVTETAWHNLFARNMFIQPHINDLKDLEPEFTILHAPSFLADPVTDGTASSTFIILNLATRMILIGGSAYAGEIKKSIFSVMNYLMPSRGILPMHCSANIGSNGDTAIFFGLSGTGKTTLSADSSRTLIGDDEHGWGAKGLFNFEGGCYAKTINLTVESEPEIFDLCHTFGSIIENVMMDPNTRGLNFFDSTYSENGRVSYEIGKVPNASASGQGGHPDNIVMLTCDAFGVLPPISQLTPDQAMYHFLSGYTAKVAGTEKGLQEPAATFSACFGAPFLPREPNVYAQLLRQKMARHGVKCWLVNTGWSGGGYGVGERINIAFTRAMVNAVLNGSLDDVEFTLDPSFGVLIPKSCPGVPVSVLNQRSTWADAAAYDSQVRILTQRFEANFKQFEDHVDDKVRAIAIRAVA